MSNHNFEDRFFKTRRILELTIFFFLAFSLLSFSYSDFVPITKKVIYDINPNITVKPYLVDRTPLITYKDAEFSREASKYRAEKIGKVFFKQVYLKDIVLEIEEDHPLIYDLDKNVVNKKLYHKFSLLTNNTSDYNCAINDKILNCDFISNFNGTIDLNVGLESLYDNYSESVVTINVLPVYDSPKIEKNFESLGKTSNSNETFTIDLNDYFSDDDNDLLTYGVDLEGNLDLNCDLNNSVLNNSVFNCTSTSKGYKDLKFYAYDGKERTYLNTYRIAVIDDSDLNGFSSSYDIIEGLDFNLDFNLKSKLNYAIYNLPILIESEGLDISKDYNLNFGSGEEKIIYQNLEIPDVNTSNVYEVKLTVFGIEKIKNDLNVIDYVDLNNYVSIEKIVPEKDTKVPHSVILAIPFTVINNLDSNVELYYCGEAYENPKIVLYNSDLQQTLNNFSCSKKIFNQGNNIIEIYVKGSLPYVWSLGMNITAYLSETELTRDPVNYLSSNNLLFDIDDYYNEDVYGSFGSIIPNVNSLITNTNYIAKFSLINYSSFDIINLNVCAKTYYREDSTSNYILSLENDYYKILSNPNCFTIDRLESNFWAENIVSFDFKTKDNVIANTYIYPKKGIALTQIFTNNYENVINGARGAFTIN